MSFAGPKTKIVKCKGAAESMWLCPSTTGLLSSLVYQLRPQRRQSCCLNEDCPIVKVPVSLKQLHGLLTVAANQRHFLPHPLLPTA